MRSQMRTDHVGLWSLLLCILAATAAADPPPPGRLLTDFTNDDGNPPDGHDNDKDDTAALRKALAAGPGVVHIGPGFYRFGDVLVPSGVSVVGARGASIVRSSGPGVIFLQKSVSDWTLRDLVLDGQAKGEWRKRTDQGRCGIHTSQCSGFEIAGVTVRNFNGAGVQLTRTASSGFCDGGTLERITAVGNYVGVRLDERAEYVKAAKLTCVNNVIGCVIHAGNTTLAASNLGYNVDGLVIEDKDNGSHGTVSNCLINHNRRYALLARNVRHGMAVGGCCFFYGSILLENSVGVNLTAGLIGCPVTSTGSGANRIAGNHVILKTGPWQLSPSTIVQDNFTENGPWQP